ncbi:Autophagy protein 22 [Physocladia obscura]|uniref:Autophagy-related protein n=1 Tax=Physocladia obscura TaxID=109957 RepID=A0AAD5SUI8_9FUNG|nr:Autophagy protein 22 [Physocladia obscura]
MTNDSQKELISGELNEFEDVDSSPVSRTELRAWFAFGSLADPISFCQGFFIPLIVEGMAASVGFEHSDHTVPCNTTEKSYSCDVEINGSWVDTSSFYFYTITLATFSQLVLFIALGAIADHGGVKTN